MYVSVLQNEWERVAKEGEIPTCLLHGCLQQPGPGPAEGRSWNTGASSGLVTWVITHCFRQALKSGAAYEPVLLWHVSAAGCSFTHCATALALCVGLSLWTLACG